MDLLDLTGRLNANKYWQKEPVFCFTGDVDWASEDALQIFLGDLQAEKIPLHLFVTHPSERIAAAHSKGFLQRGIHPNFLEGSSHGNSFTEVIDTCMSYAPEAKGFRCHRYFDVNDINELLYNTYGFRYVSNFCTTLQPGIKPYLHRSGLVHFPIFFEDGGYIYNQLELNIEKYRSLFESPGIKIINLHPMNYVVNPPDFRYMRTIKDNTPRDDYNRMDKTVIDSISFKGTGIRDVCRQVFALARQHRIVSLEELYHLSIS